MHPLSSLEALSEGPAARAAAARRDAQTCRDQADEAISARIAFKDPAYDISWRVRQHWLAMAVICDELADTFESHALADHLQAS